MTILYGFNEELRGILTILCKFSKYFRVTFTAIFGVTFGEFVSNFTGIFGYFGEYVSNLGRGLRIVCMQVSGSGTLWDLFW